MNQEIGNHERWEFYITHQIAVGFTLAVRTDGIILLTLFSRISHTSLIIFMNTTMTSSIKTLLPFYGHWMKTSQNQLCRLISCHSGRLYHILCIKTLVMGWRWSCIISGHTWVVTDFENNYWLHWIQWYFIQNYARISTILHSGLRAITV